MFNFFKKTKNDQEQGKKQEKDVLKNLNQNEQEEAKLLLDCDNELILCKAFYQVGNEKLQEIILSKISLSDFLGKIALNEDVSDNLRIIAMKKANSQEIFETLATSNGSEDIKLFALKNIKEKDDKFWFEIIIKEEKEYKELIKFCIGKIKNQKVLKDIVEYSFYYTWSYAREHKLGDIKKELAVEAIEDLNILECLVDNYRISDKIKLKIVKKVTDENVLMKAYKWGYSEVRDAITLKLEELGYENSLVEIIITSKDKEFISRCIPKFSNKELLWKIVEKAEFWYATLLASKRLEELGVK